MSRSARNSMSPIRASTIEEARENLREALDLFIETASPEESRTRLHEKVYVTRLEVAVG